MTENQFFSGFITLIGRPNVGKSSLMNAMIGEKISIVSSRPQTTRSRLMGVLTKENRQAVFLDTPGIHQPQNRLGEYMMQSVKAAMEGMDSVLMAVDVSSVRNEDLTIAEGLQAYHAIPRILALNKIDLVKADQILSATAKFSRMDFTEIIPVSAKTGDGMAELESVLLRRLPKGPRYFPEDMITDQPERILCAEIIREKALRHLRDEVPHGIGVEIIRIESMSDRLTEINANVYCEKESHKRIVIGKGGAMLQTIGTEARHDIEKLMGTHVNLKLWVKIRDDWRNNPLDLKNLGYEISK
ncbi:MAG: GTPase Era [Clostridia bacterium]|nr:GTPase Era [Clostridia bacterium]